MPHGHVKQDWNYSLLMTNLTILPYNFRLLQFHFQDLTEALFIIFWNTIITYRTPACTFDCIQAAARAKPSIKQRLPFQEVIRFNPPKGFFEILCTPQGQISEASSIRLPSIENKFSMIWMEKSMTGRCTSRALLNEFTKNWDFPTMVRAYCLRYLLISLLRWGIYNTDDNVGLCSFKLLFSVKLGEHMFSPVLNIV
jgi:hypothetical protein